MWTAVMHYIYVFFLYNLIHRIIIIQWEQLGKCSLKCWFLCVTLGRVTFSETLVTSNIQQFYRFLTCFLQKVLKIWVLLYKCRIRDSAEVFWLSWLRLFMIQLNKNGIEESKMSWHKLPWRFIQCCKPSPDQAKFQDLVNIIFILSQSPQTQNSS